jgi:hypothetical protein
VYVVIYWQVLYPLWWIAGILNKYDYEFLCSDSWYSKPRGHGKSAGLHWGRCAAGGWHWRPKKGSSYSPGEVDAVTASLLPRPSVRGKEPHPTRGGPVTQNTADLMEWTLKNNPQSYGVKAVLTGWMAVGESVTIGTLWDTRQPPSWNDSLTRYGNSAWWTVEFPDLMGQDRTFCRKRV